MKPSRLRAIGRLSPIAQKIQNVLQKIQNVLQKIQNVLQLKRFPPESIFFPFEASKTP
jgi:hypothetical protein